MRTAAISGAGSTKKLIDLPNDVCRRLAVQAASMGMSVKKLIEQLVISAMDDADDEALYAYLLETRPEGRELISLDEQETLMSQLRAKAAGNEV